MAKQGQKKTTESAAGNWSGRKFRNKPVVVEAQQIHEMMTVRTPFGPATGAVGDWLITAADGQQWFCTDEYFRENYEPVADEPEEQN